LDPATQKRGPDVWVLPPPFAANIRLALCAPRRRRSARPGDRPRGPSPLAGRDGEISMITVIGYDGSEPSPAARARLEAATLVTGPERLLRRLHPAESGVPPAAAADPLAAAEAHLAAGRGPAVVLADGDPGFFGAVRALRERGITPEVLPAVPAVSRAFGRAAIPWEDALVVATDDCRRAANVCRAHHKVAVLVRPGVGPAELARELAPTTPRTLIVVEDLGGPE